LSPRPATTARLILTINTSKDAVSRKEMPFGGRNASNNFKGVHFRPNPQILAGMGISSLNKTINNFSTAHAIFAQISSIGAAWQRKLKNSNKITKIAF
jgi:hypothetical protein